MGNIFFELGIALVVVYVVGAIWGIILGLKDRFTSH